jgi:hypothetical protein
LEPITIDEIDPGVHPPLGRGLEKPYVTSRLTVADAQKYGVLMYG